MGFPNAPLTQVVYSNPKVVYTTQYAYPVQSPPAHQPASGQAGGHTGAVVRLLAVLLLWFEFSLLAAELVNSVKLCLHVRTLTCMEDTLQGSRSDSYARTLLPPTDALGRVVTYLLVAIVLSAVSLLYFVVTLVRFVRHSGCSLRTPLSFGEWWEERADLEDEDKRQLSEEDMGSWCGTETRNPLTGPRVYAVVGFIIGLLSYFGSGLYEWMTSSEEYFRTRYSTLGYLSLIFLILSARHVAGMAGTVLFCRRRQGKAICSGAAMLIVGISLYSANSKDSFPCDLSSSYSYMNPPPMTHDACGSRPEQEFAARSLGVYSAPVTASLTLVTSLGTVRGGSGSSSSSSYSPAYFCNATVSIARAPSLTVHFNKFFASGALVALTPPALCPGAASALALPPALRAEGGYSEGSVLSAWLGFRAPTSEGAGNARITLQLLAGTAGESYLPRPPQRWEENKYPPRSGASTSIPPGTGGRFALSEAGDSNPFKLASDTAASVCSSPSSSGGGCQGSWALSAVQDLAGSGLQVGLGTFGGEAWVWRVEPASSVSLAYAGLGMCAEKEDLG